MAKRKRKYKRSPKQIAAARRNIKKAQAARRKYKRKSRSAYARGNRARARNRRYNQKADRELRAMPAWQREWRAKENARSKDKKYQALKAAYERAATFHDVAFAREAKKMGIRLDQTLPASTFAMINARISPLHEDSRRAYRALIAHGRSH